jgi:hypothetical protein
VGLRTVMTATEAPRRQRMSPVISTRNLGALPDIPTLRRLLQSLAVLDAILSPDWQSRYYSFNSRWAESLQMGSMRNGSGDDWFALFTPEGAGIVGLSHEAPMFRAGAPWPGIFQGVPAELAELTTEPAFDPPNTTFVSGGVRRIWGGRVARWSTRPATIPTAQQSCLASWTAIPGPISSSPLTTMKSTCRWQQSRPSTPINRSRMHLCDS